MCFSAGTKGVGQDEAFQPALLLLNPRGNCGLHSPDWSQSSHSSRLTAPKHMAGFLTNAPEDPPGGSWREEGGNEENGKRL